MADLKSELPAHDEDRIRECRRLLDHELRFALRMMREGKPERALVALAAAVSYERKAAAVSYERKATAA